MSKNQILRQNIGIDISKEEFEAHLVVLTDQLNNRSMGHRTFKNTITGIESFIKWADKKADPSVELEFTMEATGVYYENLAFTLYERERTIHVVLPNLAKKFAESLGLKSKTDKLDAHSLGIMGVERKLTKWQPASKNLKQLKILTRERSKRKKEKTRAKNQLHALENSYNPPSSSIERYKELIDFLKDQEKAIEKEIIHLIKKDEVLNAKIQKITSTPGLGIPTVACIVAETNGFAAITSIKQLQSFAGYDIQLRESGKWKGKTRISKKGNSYIRHALYFPAYTIIKYSSHYKAFYDKLYNNKGKSLIAATAIQRKLLGLIYTLWKNDTYFDPNYAQGKAA
ncbi:MAG: IS110 family transposase [Bacteroidales bacterium]